MQWKQDDLLDLAFDDFLAGAKGRAENDKEAVVPGRIVSDVSAE